MDAHLHTESTAVSPLSLTEGKPANNKRSNGESGMCQYGPREKLFKLGPAALDEAELLALLLRTGPAGQSASQLAHRLLEHSGGLSRLLARDAWSLVTLHGIGPAKAAELAAVREVARRLTAGESGTAPSFTSPADCASFLAAELGGLEREVFACLFLDNRHRRIRFEKLFYGTIDSASVYPREVVKRALLLNAAAVIIAHNHPSGVCEPSEADRQITIRLRDGLGLVDIRLLDHFVVGDGPPLSFAERGLL